MAPQRELHRVEEFHVDPPGCEGIAPVLPRALLACVLILAGPWRDARAEPGPEYISEWSTGGSDLPNDRVQKFTLSGTFVTMWGTSGSGAGQFSSPAFLSLDAAGNVFVFDGLNSRVQNFSANGGYLAQWGSFGQGHGQFISVRDSAVLPAGDILVTDQTHRVQRFRPCTSCPAALPVGGPKILMRVAPLRTQRACAAGVVPDCRQAVVRAELSTTTGPFYFVYLLVAPQSISSLAGVQCGITYEANRPQDIDDHRGVDIFSWTRCATLEFPTAAPAWPRPGSGSTLTWDPQNACQHNSAGSAVAGYFYVAAYSPDNLRVVQHPGTSSVHVADCQGVEYALQTEALGAVSFSAGATSAGCNPCVSSYCNMNQPTAVQVVSWGTIKALFGAR